MNELTVLLAEDNDRQALLITQSLQRNTGVGQVVRFKNGRDILNYLFPLSDRNVVEGKFVLLLDILIPHISGIEVLKAVKNHDNLKSLPIIIFTSSGDPRVRDLCYQYGCNAFIIKPLDHKEFDNLSMLDFIPLMQVPVVGADIIVKTIMGGFHEN